MKGKQLKKIRSILNSGETLGGQTTIEYVVVIGVVVGLSALLVVFRDAIGTALTNAGTGITNLFNTLAGDIT